MVWVRTVGDSSPRQEPSLLHSTDRSPLILLAAFPAVGVLAMIATWFLVADYPIPDDDAIYLGLLGFLFIVFLDLFFIVFVCYLLAMGNFRQGERWWAVKWSIGLFLSGLLVASVVGSLPWLLRRLVVALPWLTDVPWWLTAVPWWLFFWLFPWLFRLAARRSSR